MKKVRTPEPEGFAEFWAVWQPMARHTDGRGLAREAYRKHILNGAEPQDIIDGARWFMRGVKDKQFVPLSATWLNREPWPDLCEQERSYQRRLAEIEDRKEQGNVLSIRRAVIKPSTINEDKARHAQMVLANAGLRAAE